MGNTFYTKQKNIVYQAMLHSYDHPTAEMVLAKCREVMPKISRATIYRNLKDLANEKKIRRIELSGEDRFDITTNSHAHFTCKCCGAFFDVNDIKTSKILNNNYDGISKIDEIDVILSGLCEKCKTSK